MDTKLEEKTSKRSPRVLQGQSREFTLYKELGLSAIFSILVNNRRWQKEYKYIDLNSGAGWNASAKVKGSPLVFIETAEKLNRRYTAYFVDRRQEAIQNLSYILKDRLLYCNLYVADNKDALEFLPLNPWDAGILLCDPNGYKDLPSIELLNSLPSNIDIVLSWNSMSIKRLTGYFKNNPSPCSENIPILTEYIEKVNRKNWLIRKPFLNDKWKFTMLVGSNLPLYDQPADGFYNTTGYFAQQLITFFTTLGAPSLPELFYHKSDYLENN